MQGMGVSIPVRAFAMCFILCALAGYGLAQESRLPTIVTGTVLDPSEAAVVGARIVLLRNGVALRTAVSDTEGVFRFDALPVGGYEITVEKEGFQPATAKFRIGNKPLGPIAVHLGLADVQATVTVSGQATQVSTNSADNLDTVTLNRQSLDDLPIFDQDYIGTMSRFLDSGSIATGGVTIIVDGVESSRAGVSASAIQEVKINSDPYSAEYPRPGRSRIEIITKPGSSEFHGTFNFLFRDYHLNARDPFALSRPSEQRRIFEGSLTGPLGRSKRASFLISANREEEDQQAVIFADDLAGPIRQTVAAPSRNTEISGSLNRQIGENQIISIRGIYTDRTIQNQGAGGLTLAEAATNFEDREDIVYFNHRGPITGKFYNLFRFLVARQHTPTTSVNAEPKVIVLGAYGRRGSRRSIADRESHRVQRDRGVVGPEAYGSIRHQCA